MAAGTGYVVDTRVGAVAVAMAVAVTLRANGFDKREASGGSRGARSKLRVKWAEACARALVERRRVVVLAWNLERD